MIFEIPAGIIITGGRNDEAISEAAEVYDVSSGESCQIPQLKSYNHIQVIVDILTIL